MPNTHSPTLSSGCAGRPSVGSTQGEKSASLIRVDHSNGKRKARPDYLLRRLDEVLPRQFIKVSAYVLLAVLLTGVILYWLSIPGKALTSYNDAKRLYDSGKYSNALYAVNESLRDRGLRLKAYRLRADIYLAMQQFQDAVADITRVIGLQPDLAENYDFRAHAYLELQDAASAAKDYTKLIALNGSADAYNDRGLCYLKLNDTSKAISDFTKAIEVEPRVEFYLQRSLAHSGSGDHPAAIRDLDRALDLQSQSMTAMYCYRARAAEKQKMGDAAGSAEDIQKALAIEAQNSLGASGKPE